MDLDTLRSCLKEGQGYSLAYDASIRAKSTEEDVVRFSTGNISRGYATRPFCAATEPAH